MQELIQMSDYELIGAVVIISLVIIAAYLIAVVFRHRPLEVSAPPVEVKVAPVKRRKYKRRKKTKGLMLLALLRRSRGKVVTYDELIKVLDLEGNKLPVDSLQVLATDARQLCRRSGDKIDNVKGVGYIIRDRQKELVP